MIVGARLVNRNVNLWQTRSIRCIAKTSKNECIESKKEEEERMHLGYIHYTLPERLIAVETIASFLAPCPTLAIAETPADRDVADVEPRLAVGSGPLAASDVPGS